MAWASIAALGKAADKTAGTTIVTGTGGDALAVGDFVVVVVARDNASTSDGATSEVTQVVDSDGVNVYTKAAEYCNGQGSAGAGATVSVWYSVLTDALGTGATWTATFSNTVTASSIISWGFTRDTNKTVSVAGIVNTVVDGTDLETQPATLSGLPNKEYLFVRGCAVEISTFGFTQTTNYTPFETHTTTGDAADTNMAVAAEFRILTATGDTSDCGHGTGDHAAVYVAFSELGKSDILPPSIHTYRPFLVR